MGRPALSLKNKNKLLILYILLICSVIIRLRYQFGPTIMFAIEILNFMLVEWSKNSHTTGRNT